MRGLLTASLSSSSALLCALVKEKLGCKRIHGPLAEKWCIIGTGSFCAAVSMSKSRGSEQGVHQEERQSERMSSKASTRRALMALVFSGKRAGLVAGAHTHPATLATSRGARCTHGSCGGCATIRLPPRPIAAPGRQHPTFNTTQNSGPCSRASKTARTGRPPKRMSPCWQEGCDFRPHPGAHQSCQAPGPPPAVGVGQQGRGRSRGPAPLKCSWPLGRRKAPTAHAQSTCYTPFLTEAAAPACASTAQRTAQRSNGAAGPHTPPSGT